MIPRRRTPPVNRIPVPPTLRTPPGGTQKWTHCAEDVPCNGARGCACGEKVRAELEQAGEETNQ